MPAPDKRAVVAREWIAKAENDLKNAAHTLKLGADCPTDTAGRSASCSKTSRYSDVGCSRRRLPQADRPA